MEKRRKYFIFRLLHHFFSPITENIFKMAFSLACLKEELLKILGHFYSVIKVLRCTTTSELRVMSSIVAYNPSQSLEAVEPANLIHLENHQSPNTFWQATGWDISIRETVDRIWFWELQEPAKQRELSVKGWLTVNKSALGKIRVPRS